MVIWKSESEIFFSKLNTNLWHLSVVNIKMNKMNKNVWKCASKVYTVVYQERVKSSWSSQDILKGSWSNQEGNDLEQWKVRASLTIQLAVHYTWQTHNFSSFQNNI